MPSALIYFCLDLNQLITDKIYRYRTNLFWNISRQAFFTETRLFPHNFLWKFINIILVLGIGFPTCFIVLLDALFHPGNYRLFPVLFVVVQLYFAVIILTNFRLTSSDLAQLMNELIRFECEIQKNSYRKIGNGRRHDHNVLSFLSHFRLNSGNIDLIGIAMILLTLSMAMIPMPFPLTALYLKLDAPYFFVKVLVPKFQYIQDRS